VHELLYCSIATREMLEADILDLLKMSRDNNTRLDVTGLLVYQKRTNDFLQILEGEKEVIFDLLETIKAVDRHHNFHVIYQNKLGLRKTSSCNLKVFSQESRQLFPVRSQVLKEIHGNRFKIPKARIVPVV
jgi:hypothetical protein